MKEKTKDRCVKKKCDSCGEMKWIPEMCGTCCECMGCEEEHCSNNND